MEKSILYRKCAEFLFEKGNSFGCLIIEEITGNVTELSHYPEYLLFASDEYLNGEHSSFTVDISNINNKRDFRIYAFLFASVIAKESEVSNA